VPANAFKAGGLSAGSREADQCQNGVGEEGSAQIGAAEAGGTDGAQGNSEGAAARISGGSLAGSPPAEQQNGTGQCDNANAKASASDIDSASEDSASDSASDSENENESDSDSDSGSDSGSDSENESENESESDSDSASASDSASDSESGNCTIAYPFEVESFPGKTDHPSKKHNSSADTHKPTCMLKERILRCEQQIAKNHECNKLHESCNKPKPHSHHPLSHQPHQWQSATATNKLRLSQIRLQKIRPPQIRPTEIRPSQRRPTKAQAPQISPAKVALTGLVAAEQLGLAEADHGRRLAAGTAVSERAHLSSGRCGWLQGLGISLVA
jgi:hypothetical protein